MSREVYLRGDINVENITKTSEEIRKLYKENPEEEITLYICSVGGIRSLAISFYEWVNYKNIPLITVAIGEVSSAAVIVFLSGKKRRATLHSWFGIHPGGGGIKDDVWRQLLRMVSPWRYREEMEWLRTVRSIEEEIIKEKVKLPEKQIRKALTKAHLIFTAEKAKEVGLIDEIIQI